MSASRQFKPFHAANFQSKTLAQSIKDNLGLMFKKKQQIKRIFYLYIQINWIIIKRDEIETKAKANGKKK